MASSAQFKVGAPLIAGRRNWLPHNRLDFGESGLVILDFWAGACHHETLAVMRAPFELALAEEEGVPFVLYRAGGHPWSDVDYSYHRGEASGRADLADDGALAVTLVVVEASSGVVKAVRKEACDAELAEALRAMAARDAGRRYDESERGEAVGRAHRRFPTPEALLASASIRRSFEPGPGGDEVQETTGRVC